MLPELLELMKIPEIAPDEDIHGWLNAVAEANGWDYDSFVSAFLPGCYISPEDRNTVHISYYNKKLY